MYWFLNKYKEKEIIEVSAVTKEEAEELVLMGDYQDSQIKERTWQDQVIHKVEEIKDDEWWLERICRRSLRGCFWR